MSINLKEEQDLDFSQQMVAETPISIQNKFRNNSVISSNKDQTFLSSEIMSQNNVKSPRIQELKKIKQRYMKENSLLM